MAGLFHTTVRPWTDPTVLVCAAVFVQGCATAGGAPRANDFDPGVASAVDQPIVADPFEPVNRKVFAFNSALDRYIADPIIDGYRTITPAFARRRIHDFLNNLRAPVWFANEVLQADWDGAGAQATRFTLNSTLGVAGFFDFAAQVADIEMQSEDFGQTLAVWGVPTGPYVVVPGLGPATPRALAGMAVDGALFNPFVWVEFEDKSEFVFARRLAATFDRRARADGMVGIIRESLDPYAQTKALYIQDRLSGLSENDDDYYDDLPDLD